MRRTSAVRASTNSDLYYEVGTAGCAVAAAEAKGSCTEETASFGCFIEHDTFEQDYLCAEKDIMDSFRGILRSDGLALVADKEQTRIGKDLCCLLGDGGFAFDEYAFGCACFRCFMHYQLCVLFGDIACVLCNEAVSDKGFKTDLVYRFAVVYKMERGIDMSSVMGAHREVGQVADVAVFYAHDSIHDWLRIAGENIAGEDLLRNIYQHFYSPLICGLYAEKLLYGGALFIQDAAAFMVIIEQTALTQTSEQV